MEDTNKKAVELIDRYLQGMCTPEECAIVEAVYKQYAHQKPFREGDLDFTRIGEDSFLKISATIDGQQRRPVRLWPRIAAAAALLAFLSFGLYQYLHKNTTPKTEYANDIAPGSGKPYLTLANGQKIVLGGNNGVLAKQGNVTIQQDTTGKVSYTSGKAKIVDAPYNTLTNPRGGKVVSLVLPDGTLVKLEAASSITYQTVFTGKTRSVTTTGKVYFAVNYNKDQPFYATTKGQVTEDFGTHFIVEAFDEEPAIKTTLIEGSVSVSKDGHKVLLKPGQQTLSATTLKAQQADLDHETAWINGDFDFNNQDLHSIMRELARVYNIDVSYKGDVENMVLNGMISRSRNISAVLEMFEATNNVHFEINGRRVIVIARQ
jgi:transmembrane sensor